MLIKKWMSKQVITINSDASLMDASAVFKKRLISILPVMENGKIIGVVTDGDIKKASPSDATSLDIYELMYLVHQIKIKEVMSSPVVTITCDGTVDEAAKLMLLKNISGMPVLDPEGKMTGIITKSDIFRCLVSFTGVINKGQVFAFKLKDKPGVIKTLTEIIREFGGRPSSILTSYDDVEDGFREVFIYCFGLAQGQFGKICEELQKTAWLIYAADLEQNIRKHL